MSKKVTSQLRPHMDGGPIPNWSPLLSPGREEVRARFTSPMTQFLLSAPEQARAMGGRPSRAQRQKPILSSKQVSDQREGREDRGRPTDKTIEKNLDNGHLRNSSRGRERGSVRGRARNKSRRRVGGIHPPTNHRAYIAQQRAPSLPVSLFSLIPPQAETFICLRTA